MFKIPRVAISLWYNHHSRATENTLTFSEIAGSEVSFYPHGPSTCVTGLYGQLAGFCLEIRVETSSSSGHSSITSSMVEATGYNNKLRRAQWSNSVRKLAGFKLNDK